LLSVPSLSTPDEWATHNRTYPRTAAVPGPRDPLLTPYVVQIERAIAGCLTKRIVVVTAAQAGKTDLLLDVAGWRLDQRPAPILYVGPNKQFLTEQFEPRIMLLLDEAPSLADKVARGKRMTKTRKIIAGVPFRLAHAGSSAALKSDPAALALVDEYDEMLANIKGQGDPLGLVERRGDTYADFCCAVTSTPRRGVAESLRDETSGLIFWCDAPAEDIYESPIWRLWQQGSKHHWCWPCPQCKSYFVPRFDLMQFDHTLPPVEAAKSVYLLCPSCGGIINNSHKTWMNSKGLFVAPGQHVEDGVVVGEALTTDTLSYWVSGLASPFVTFEDRVKSYLQAAEMNDPAMVQTAINAGFGELYAPGGGNIKDWQRVAQRKGTHRFGELPDEVVRVSAAIDVQGNGFYYSIRGWGARATSWQIESGELAGYTDEPEIWNDLAHTLTQTFDGLPILLALIDTGFRPNKPNSGSDNVTYEFCRRFRRFVRPTKGWATLSAPIMRGKTHVTMPGQRAEIGLELVRLDTDFWKQRLHERLAWPENQPGGFWLSADATEDYCRQLVSEVRTVTPSGRAEWVQIGKRNHYLDCEAMNEAAGHLLNAQKIPVGMTRSKGMAQPAASTTPTQPPAAEAQTPVNAQQTQQRRGWLGGNKTSLRDRGGWLQPR
jgi:phage terminase large subunit GpA-like protein